jgi:DNA-binding transcriptional regulator YiaG
MAYKLPSELKKDLKDIFTAESPEKMKRFKTPTWHTDAARIKELRRKLKVSQKDFALGLGTHIKTVQHWEQTAMVPDLPRKVLALLFEEPSLFEKLKRA